MRTPRPVPLYAPAARRLLVLAVAVGLVGALLAPVARAAPEPPPFIVIVHPQNPAHALDRAFVSDAFLKKATRWDSGEVIRPVDLSPTSGVRERFSNDVLKRSLAAVRSYWQQVIFSGRDVPPPEVTNDEDVVKYVLGHPGAIGYVSGTAALGDARPVTLR